MSANEAVSTEKPQESGPLDLPDPSELPNADILIFDGKCNFCIGQVRRLKKWDGRGRLAFLSLHDPRVKDLCPDLTDEQLMEQMFLIALDGRRFGGAAAIRYLSRKLPKLWFAAPLLHIPFSLPLWQWIYLKIAARRYRISGKNNECEEGGTCEVHFGKK